ncbi:MAG: 3'-5' exoribonuclease [Prevotella sp.]|nr:3'-5' exoribonuclease [Prevotella sp.]
MVEVYSEIAQEYALKIQNIVSEINIQYNEHLVDDDTARKRYGARVGEKYYLFPNEAPTQEIIDAYEQVKPYFGEGEDRVTFEEHLSHKGMSVFFYGKDLLIRKDRYNPIRKLTEANLRSAIDFVKSKYRMTEDNANIYIFPYGSMDFIISESFEKHSGRYDHRKESNWLVFPLTADFNYKLLRQECRDYAKLHPLEKEPMPDFSFNLEEMVKNALLKTIHEKYGDVPEEEMSNIINQLADNLDDEEDEDDIIENMGETIEESPVVLEYSSSIKANFIAIDLETATSDRSSICQIGITEVVDGKICDTKSWLVQPEGNRYDSMNIWIHGITPNDTKNSPSFPDVWKEVQPYLQNKIVVAHNTSFDMYALKNAFDKYGMEYPTFDYYCTLRIARYTIKGCYSYSLDVVLNHLGINMGQHHKADSDSRACAMLLLKCLEMDGSTLEDLESKYDFHRGAFAPNKFKAHLKNEKVYKYKSIIESLETNTDLLDENNYFFGKSVCFTGTCKYGVRKDLLQKIKDVGGIPMDSVTKDTNVLVVGQQDYRVVGEDGMSSKQKKALKLLEKGYDIEILSETEFYNRF